jgi:hypothetical protein
VVRELAMIPERAPRDMLAALASARARHARVRPHRALVRLEFAPYLVQALLLPALFCALLWRFEPELVAIWREAILAAAAALDLPLSASAREAGLGEVRLVWLYLRTDTVLPSRIDLWANAAGTLAVVAATFALPARWLPLRYFVRILAAVHATAIAFFAFAPGSFPYAIPDHVQALTGAGYVLLLTIPPMLALGYYVLRVGLATKLAHTALILAYFIAWIPVQSLLHVVTLQHLSVVFMPLLYFCFGALLNVLLFVALYAWAASTVPERATLPRRMGPDSNSSNSRMR